MKIKEILNEWDTHLLQELPEFRAWFGNSKVVDKTGNPLPVFHYTKNEFEISEFYPLSHFGTSKAALARWQFNNDFGLSLGRIPRYKIDNFNNNDKAVKFIITKGVMDDFNIIMSDLVDMGLLQDYHVGHYLLRRYDVIVSVVIRLSNKTTIPGHELTQYIHITVDTPTGFFPPSRKGLI